MFPVSFSNPPTPNVLKRRHVHQTSSAHSPETIRCATRLQTAATRLQTAQAFQTALDLARYPQHHFAYILQTFRGALKTANVAQTCASRGFETRIQAEVTSGDASAMAGVTMVTSSLCPIKGLDLLAPEVSVCVYIRMFWYHDVCVSKIFGYVCIQMCFFLSIYETHVEKYSRLKQAIIVCCYCDPYSY
jgi:hypothetical protein